MIPARRRENMPFHPSRVTHRRHQADWIASMMVRLVVLAALLAITAAVSWLAELLLPVFYRGKHAHPARAVHDSA